MVSRGQIERHRSTFRLVNGAGDLPFVWSDNEAEQIVEAEGCAAFKVAADPAYPDRCCSRRKRPNRIGAGAVRRDRLAGALPVPKVNSRLVLDIELYPKVSKEITKTTLVTGLRLAG